MYSFLELAKQFEEKFNKRHFPQQPTTLYDAAQYILAIGGKRVRPVCVLMGNELFDEINNDAWQVASAIELFHNFSLIHDDIMDKAPLRRGMQTVHAKYGDATALLAGDVMFAQAYDYLTRIDMGYVQKIISLFNKTSKEVCEGQQIDMDFENRNDVGIEEYIKMITLKTSVLLAASLQLGAIIGGAGEGNQQHIYNFGKNLGIAFQIQDDYLDAFGNPDKFGKQVGGDILANKKTFLLLHALEVADASQKQQIENLLTSNNDDKIEQMLSLYKACGVDEWANQLKGNYYQAALKNLEDVAVLSVRKKPLLDLAMYLMERES
ncbi:MAG: polyprenyl synthetase family protein [Ferruginibacter sp.]|nr:polyprenyl synthetase family protein [Ferruginibacter sp.]